MAWTDLTQEEQETYIAMFYANGMTEQQGIDLYNEQNP